MKIVAIIQARFSSTRLPGKVLMTLGTKPMLINLVDRIKRAKSIDQVVVATSDEQTDLIVYESMSAHRIDCFRGSLNNVLERYYFCARHYGADVIARFTGDNPLIDPGLIDAAITIFKNNNIDYLYYNKQLPIGMGIEVFSFEALNKAYSEATDLECLEHVTPYMKSNPKLFKVLEYTCESDQDRSYLRFTVDTKQDFEFVTHIYRFFDNTLFNYTDILRALDLNPEWLMINQHIPQNLVKYNGESQIPNITCDIIAKA